MLGYVNKPHMEVVSFSHHWLTLTETKQAGCEIAGELAFLFSLCIFPFQLHTLGRTTELESPDSFISESWVAGRGVNVSARVHKSGCRVKSTALAFDSAE